MEMKKLNEISKIAALKASSSLSKMIHHPVGVDINPAMAITKETLLKFMQPADPVVGIFVKVSGDLHGLSLLFFPTETALAFCDRLLGKQEGATKAFSDLDVSALMEVANIVIGNFLTPFAHPLRLDSILHHVPEFKISNFDELQREIYHRLSQNILENIMIEIIISMHHFKLKGYLALMVGMQQMKEVLEQ